jgi:hypothetical protein
MKKETNSCWFLVAGCWKKPQTTNPKPQTTTQINKKQIFNLILTDIL